MENSDTLKIIIISGPCGVGKSTVSKQLKNNLKKSALISGDAVHDMFRNDSGLSWEVQLALCWEQIVLLTRNFVKHQFHIIIDFVVEDEFEWFCRQIKDLPVELTYVVLRADPEILIKRLTERGDEDLVNRSLYLLKQFEISPFHTNYFYDTTQKLPDEIIREVLENNNFKVPTS